jgi:hypothetical protein
MQKSTPRVAAARGAFHIGETSAARIAHHAGATCAPGRIELKVIFEL